MYKIYNLISSRNVEKTGEAGPFTVITHLQDLSGSGKNALQSYYASLLRKRRRQLICTLSQNTVKIGEGMIQWMVGNIAVYTNVASPVSYLQKVIRSKMANQSVIVSECSGTGEIILEPVEADILLVSLEDWQEGIILESDMFLAAEDTVELTIANRTNLSSAMFGEEGLFNLQLKGSGVAAIKIPCPKETIVEVDLHDDILRLDGSFALAWSSTLKFSVEPAGETIPASILSGEGYVNTYSGTGQILLAPMLNLREQDEAKKGPKD